MLMSGLLGAMLFSYISMSPFVLRDQYGLSPVGYSLAFACNAVGMIVGGRVNALVVLRRGPATMLLVGLLLGLGRLGRRGGSRCGATPLSPYCSCRSGWCWPASGCRWAMRWRSR